MLRCRKRAPSVPSRECFVFCEVAEFRGSSARPTVVEQCSRPVPMHMTIMHEQQWHSCDTPEPTPARWEGHTQLWGNALGRPATTSCLTSGRAAPPARHVRLRTRLMRACTKRHPQTVCHKLGWAHLGAINLDHVPREELRNRTMPRSP